MARYLVAIALLAVIAGTATRTKKPKQSPLAAEAEQKKKEAEVVDKRYKSVLKNTDRTAAPVRAIRGKTCAGPPIPKPANSGARA